MIRPLISVCLPTFNRAQYLLTALESIRNQTYKNFELIVCNDGSTDKTKRIISTFHTPCSMFHVITHKKNIGYTQSILECAREAKGNWVLFFSDDDVMEPEILDIYVRAIKDFENANPAIITAQVRHIDDKGLITYTPRKQLTQNEFLLCKPKEFIFNYTLHGKKIHDLYDFNTSFPSTLFKRNIFLKYYNESDKLPVAHDLLISSKICLKYSVVVIDTSLMSYRLHDNWGSKLNSSGKFLDEYLRYLKLLSIFIRNNNISFDYDFSKTTTNALVDYLVQYNGGIVRAAIRYKGSYLKRVRLILDYTQYCLSVNPKIVLRPTYYAALIISLLPQPLVLQCAKLLHIL